MRGNNKCKSQYLIASQPHINLGGSLKVSVFGCWYEPELILGSAGRCDASVASTWAADKGEAARRCLDIGLEERRPTNRSLVGWTAPCNEDTLKLISFSSFAYSFRKQTNKCQRLNMVGASLARAMATQEATRAANDELSRQPLKQK